MSQLAANFANTIIVVSQKPLAAGLGTHRTGTIYGFEIGGEKTAVFLVVPTDVLIRSLGKVKFYTSRPLFPNTEGHVVEINESDLELDPDFSIAILFIAIESFDGKLATDSIPSSMSLKLEQGSAAIAEGEFILSPGYPDASDLVSPDYPIVRGGCIARINDFLERKNDWFLIDSRIYASHEGAPVHLRPWPYSLAGSEPITQPWLIGIVESSILVQRQLPVSQQENFALARVYPVSRLEALIERVRQRRALW